MQALLRTADGLEIIISMPKFVLTYHRPILSVTTNKNGKFIEATHLRSYNYVATAVDSDTPIYEEVFDNADKEY